MKKNIRIYSFIIYFIFFSLLFQNYIEQVISPFKNLDEVMPIFLIIMLIIKVIINNGDIYIESNYHFKNNIKIVISIILLLFIGIYSNSLYKYQDIIPIISDIILVFKGFISYVAAKMVFYDFSFSSINKSINFLLRVITIVLFILVIVNYKIGIFNLGEIRYGLPSQQLFFSHPTYLASIGIAIISILTMLSKEYNKNNIFIGMMAFVVFSTQRNKAIIFLVAYYLLYYMIVVKQKRVEITRIGILATVMIYVGWAQIEKYLSNPEWARSALMLKSFVIANEYFPIGTGFATYATWTSGVYYSPLYYQYGLSSIYGLSPVIYDYIGDTYWPAIIGQFGYIGVLLVILIIIQIYRNISTVKCKYKYLAQIGILTYLLILSTAETSFMSPVAPLLCILMAI